MIDVAGWICRVLVLELLARAIEKLFYWPGWALLRVLSFGYYPPAQSTRHNRFAVALFAAISVMSVILIPFN
ncbi:hypothetical protein LK542_18970 [Massilia sp. IC2-477]|uniref:hypothetical protein n=1 Tax=Massilia sp. IC2-477 TaxID=2887198 RepID=UPI001D11CBC3|nr:hypothetical protein [Massilia sp. IC2-477]MCC2957704.1 hypothetical protein [Massilia sp. IC2-477]